MASEIEFLFDFGSPNAYLVHKVVPALEERTEARVTYTPVLLGGLFKLANNRSPIEAYAAIPNKLAYERREMDRFIAAHGITKFRFNPHFPINTLHLMRGAIAARDVGVFDRYVDAMFSAMWEQRLKMDDPTIIGDALEAAHLPSREIIAGTQDQRVKDTLMAATQAAHARGAFGAPTFFVGDEMFFGKDKLPAVEAEVRRRSQAA